MTDAKTGLIIYVCGQLYAIWSLWFLRTPMNFFQRPEVLIFCTDMSIKEARSHPAFLTVHACMLCTETKAALESGQVLVEHAHSVAKIQFRSQAKSAFI